MLNISIAGSINYQFEYVIFSLLMYVSVTTDFFSLSLHDALPISRLEHVIGQLREIPEVVQVHGLSGLQDRKSTRLNSSHVAISYAVFCLKKKKKNKMRHQQ